MDGGGGRCSLRRVGRAEWGAGGLGGNAAALLGHCYRCIAGGLKKFERDGISFVEVFVPGLRLDLILCSCFVGVVLKIRIRPVEPGSKKSRCVGLASSTLPVTFESAGSRDGAELVMDDGGPGPGPASRSRIQAEGRSQGLHHQRLPPSQRPPPTRIPAARPRSTTHMDTWGGLPETNFTQTLLLEFELIFRAQAWIPGPSPLLVPGANEGSAVTKDLVVLVILGCTCAVLTCMRVNRRNATSKLKQTQKLELLVFESMTPDRVQSSTGSTRTPFLSGFRSSSSARGYKPLSSSAPDDWAWNNGESWREAGCEEQKTGPKLLGAFPCSNGLSKDNASDSNPSLVAWPHRADATPSPSIPRFLDPPAHTNRLGSYMLKVTRLPPQPPTFLLIIPLPLPPPPSAALSSTYSSRPPPSREAKWEAKEPDG
ncbi:hypothetical protein G7046_g1489 [Stylonectria norvegica]|nr:hypothetical protein G7046_g1489 [Stylonectria norvegica]